MLLLAKSNYEVVIELKQSIEMKSNYRSVLASAAAL